MPYATRSDIEAKYGAENVRKWADMDNDRSSEKIESNVTRAISAASALIDDYLRGSAVSLPLAAASETVRNCCVKITAYELYSGRGVQDVDSETGAPVNRFLADYRDAVNTIKKLAEGVIRLADPDQPTATAFPSAVSFSVSTDE